MPDPKSKDSHIFDRAPRKRKPWLEGDLQTLTRMLQGGSTHQEVADRLKRSLASVQVKSGRMGLISKVPIGGPSRPRSSPVSNASRRALDLGEAGELIGSAI